MITPTALGQSTNKIHSKKLWAFASHRMPSKEYWRGRRKYKFREMETGAVTKRRWNRKRNREVFSFVSFLSYKYDWNMSKGIARASISIIFDEIILMLGFSRFCVSVDGAMLFCHYIVLLTILFRRLASRYPSDFPGSISNRNLSSLFMLPTNVKILLGIHYTDNWYIMCVHALLS